MSEAVDPERQLVDSYASSAYGDPNVHAPAKESEHVATIFE